MKPEVARRLASLRGQFAELTGEPFRHFFCPILFRDEDVPLCQAHVVNQAIENASPRWTVQRRDVDNFYGSFVEADFVALQHREEGIAAKALLDPELSRRLRPEILLNGGRVAHFAPKGTVPGQFSDVMFDLDGRQQRIALKMSPSELEACGDGDWQIQVAHDVRVQSVVSVIKAGYLTLFEMFGYRYALSPSGAFVGALLGDFFLAGARLERQALLDAAAEYFAPAAALVRPIASDNADIRGTIEDGIGRMCWLEGVEPSRPWGMIVFVRTGKQLHAALMPMFEDDASTSRFKELFQKGEGRLLTSFARLHEGEWQIDKERRNENWPRASLTDRPEDQ